MKKYIISFVMLLATVSLAAQENLKTVTGQVVDAATQQPLAGVIVTAYGETRYSTMTDENGRYELKAPDHVTSISLRVEGYQLLQKSIADVVTDVVPRHADRC